MQRVHGVRLRTALWPSMPQCPVRLTEPSAFFLFLLKCLLCLALLYGQLCTCLYLLQEDGSLGSGGEATGPVYSQRDRPTADLQ